MFRLLDPRAGIDYTAAVSEKRLRYDPGCMAPVDPRSKRVAAAVANLQPAYQHDWSNPGTLVIHNHACLHGRGAADGEPKRILRRLMLDRVVNE
ncbi:hypothetical protein [Nocardia sp. NPDC056000]|uniref:hypothetical protein n=1 Tax=Nocardia sp. NPDC056000 TaxID=3345674 RepID=UPI0035DC6E9E